MSEKESKDPWRYDWDSARWVYLETNIKSRPAYIGFVDEDEGPNVYLLCPSIRNREGKWIDSWTWREEIGPLPSLGDPREGNFFGEVIVYKWSIKKIKELEDQHPPEIGRCWLCGEKLDHGRFCSPDHESAFEHIGLSHEML